MHFYFYLVALLCNPPPPNITLLTCLGVSPISLIRLFPDGIDIYYVIQNVSYLGYDLYIIFLFFSTLQKYNIIFFTSCFRVQVRHWPDRFGVIILIYEMPTPMNHWNTFIFTTMILMLIEMKEMQRIDNID